MRDVFSQCQKLVPQIDKMIEQVGVKIDMGKFSKWKIVSQNVSKSG